MSVSSVRTCSALSDAELDDFGVRGGGLGLLSCPRGALPLTAMDVAARVEGLIANVVVEQTFCNTLTEAIEATYIFPLPDRASVTRFQMQIGERVVEGIIDERERARESYELAIAAGQRAALAEEDRSGVFTIQVGNLAPGDVAKVRLTLVAPVAVDAGEATFAFPLVVAPRYMPGNELPGESAGAGVASDTDAVPDASRISPPVLLPGRRNPVRLSLEVSIAGAGLRIEPPRSSLHAVVVQDDGDEYRVRLEPGERLDRDFILRWKVAGDALQSSALWTPDVNGEGATLSVLLVPELPRGVSRSRDVVFLLDRSGSMDGWKMVAARRAVGRMVDTLGADDRFLVVAFSERMELPAGSTHQLERATDRARFRAVEFLAKLSAHGGTEMKEPLVRAAKALGEGNDERERVIVLVTDGQVGNEDQVLASLAPLLRGVRVFTLGIDKAVNAGFLRRLAAAGAGACELVESEDRLDEVMAKVHRRIGTPLATDLSVVAEGGELDPESMAPERLPALFAGAPLSIALRSAAGKFAESVLVRGRTPGGMPFEQRIPVRMGATSDAAAALWARTRIRDLEDAYVTRPGEKKALERRIVATSLAHHVLSRFTAFVAIDRPVTSSGGNPRRIVQAVELPSGWADAGTLPPVVGGPALMGGGFSALAPAAPAAAPARMRGSGPPTRGAAEGGMMKRARKFFGAESSPPPREVVFDRAPYEERIRALADELGRSVAARDVRAFDLGVARLVELVEDLRSLGGFDELVAELEEILSELRSALGAGLDRAASALQRLEALGASNVPRGTEPTRNTRSFWK